MAVLQILLAFLCAWFVAHAAPQGPLGSNDVMSSPQPYSFGYDFNDGSGMSQYRKESMDNAGVVKGSYGYQDSMGLYRRAEYIADDNGFRVIVKSNEPGMAAQSPADATFMVESPPPAVVAQGLTSITPAAVRK